MAIHNISRNYEEEFLGNFTGNDTFKSLVNGFFPPRREENILTIVTRLNEEEVIRLIPATIFLVLVAFCGLIGNGLVWYIYGYLQSDSNSRIFIIYLAVVDLCTCVFAAPIELATLLNQYQFDQPWKCKLSRFLNSGTTIASASILLLIAVDRHRKICRSLEWQFTNKNARLMCLGAVCLGIIYASPSLILYGVKSTNRTLMIGVNATTTECSVDDKFQNTSYMFYYQLVYLVSFLVALAIISVLYTLIGQKVKFFANRRKLRRESSSTLTDDTDTELRRTRLEKLRNMQSDVSSCDGLDDSLGLKRKPAIGLCNSTENILKSEKRACVGESRSGIEGHSTMSSALSVSTICTNTLTQSVNLQLKKKKRKSLATGTHLMFIISVVFVITFVPYLVLVLLREVKKDFVNKLSERERSVYRLFLRSYFLNAVANPVVYSIFDRRFRKAFRKTLSNIRSRLCKCKQTS